MNTTPTLLLISDDAALPDRITRLPVPRTFRPIIASAPRDAVPLYMERRPDVVLIDDRAAGADVVALLDALMEADPDAVVIVLSGAPDVAATVKAMRAGAEDVLPVSVDDGQFAAAIERCSVRASRSRGRHAAVAKSSALIGFTAVSAATKRTSPMGDAGAAIAAEHVPPGCTLLDVERRHIAHVLAISRGNRSEAARVLGISRTTLYAKMKDYGLEQVHTDVQ